MHANLISLYDILESIDNVVVVLTDDQVSPFLDLLSVSGLRPGTISGTEEPQSRRFSFETRSLPSVPEAKMPMSNELAHKGTGLTPKQSMISETLGITTEDVEGAVVKVKTVAATSEDAY